MKRARSAFRSGRLVSTPEGEQGFWPSYADMMSSFALILFFLMLISYLQNLITGNRLVSTQELLASTQTTLSSTRRQVALAQSELAALALDLDGAKASIAAQQTQIADYAATITGQTDTIATQNALIAEQGEYIALTTEELTRLRTQMQTIALLRLSILTQIRDGIAETLGDATKVRIGDNGSIILNEGLLFDYNSSRIKAESHALLDELTAAFAAFLAVEGNAQYVDSVVISGHTDDRGSAAHNRELSTQRANAVLDYLLEQNGKKLQPYDSYFCAAGYGATRPVESNATAAGRGANRRIEISIILKDESVLSIVDAYLAQEMPLATPAPAPSPSPEV